MKTLYRLRRYRRRYLLGILVIVIGNANRFVEALPDGYQTEVRERGAGLSVGQKQLLAFARAIAFNPEILLVLDEATSSVDTETEALIQDALTKLMAGRTSIIIAHRLSTIRNVDRIIVLHTGRVVEQGTHEELPYGRGRQQVAHARTQCLPPLRGGAQHHLGSGAMALCSLRHGLEEQV